MKSLFLGKRKRRSFLNLEAGKNEGEKKNADSSFLSSKDKHKKNSRQKGSQERGEVRSLNRLERFAYEHIASKLPTFPGYREAYEQAGMPLIYESYLSTAFLLSLVAMIPTFIVSALLEARLIRTSLVVSLLGSSILCVLVFAISLVLWLAYPLQRRKTFKAKLEAQLAYSFGILGVLSAAGISVERLFERLAESESNPVLSELAGRFLRNLKVFGLDTESALREVASHSPSLAFSKMLESIAVAFRTTGTLHDLVMFESSRLFSEKKDRLKKNVNDLAVMAELYITLVVVGPIVFIVMLSILEFLPLPAGSNLPPPTLLENLLVFVGIPSISAIFAILIDTMIGKM